jgi:hypothetical protein
VKLKKSNIFSAGLCLLLLFSCVRWSDENPASNFFLYYGARSTSARPTAILQTGEQPLWFQLTENGPVHIESIEDAVFSAALIPWPYAPHVSFFQERGNALVMAVNRDGFLKLAPAGEGLALYRFSGGSFWQQYTVGGFVFFEDKPAALLYFDNRFLDTAYPIPQSRTWTFNMDSNTPFPLEISALELFPVEEGWSVDTLRVGPDNLIYYRASKRNVSQPVIRMMWTADLTQGGQEITTEVFFNSAPLKTQITHPSLPPLPEGFIYTGIGMAGNNLFACWEEQVDYSIGAAGFMVIRN